MRISAVLGYLALMLTLPLVAFCGVQPAHAESALSATQSGKTDAEWATDITAEHMLTNGAGDKDEPLPGSNKGVLILLLHGTQHCAAGTKRAVGFDKSTYVSITGCWSGSAEKHDYKMVVDAAKNPESLQPAYVIQDGEGKQLLILQRGPNGCGDGHGKAFLIEKLNNQVLEGCWDGSDKTQSTFDLTWDTGLKQHIGPIDTRLFLFGGPEAATLPNGIHPSGPQIES